MMKLKCPVCNNEFMEDEAPQKDGKIEMDAIGRVWCRGCTEMFGAIVFEEAAA